MLLHVFQVDLYNISPGLAKQLSNIYRTGCVCLSTIEIYTIRPISMKFGTLDDHDMEIWEWFLCMFGKICALYKNFKKQKVKWRTPKK
jgi:hypothetical protein